MTISDTNPHREKSPAYTRVYHRGWSASGRAEATSVAIDQFIPQFGDTRVAEFKIPDERSDCDNLCAALDRAFQAGKEAKAVEVRKVLGL